MKRRPALLGMVLFSPLARSQAAPSASTAGTVWLRVRNDSTAPFEHVWQGLPQRGTSADLGPLVPGQTSAWLRLPADLPHYRKTRIQLTERQLTHVTDTSFPRGLRTLAPGRYTFAYTLQGGALQLSVIEEPSDAAPR